jgi:hypothetical protein
MSNSLIDFKFIREYLTHEAVYCQGHGAVPDGEYLGAGMLYYAIVYVLRARLCVCLGSGGGFVPRMMRQAQLDAHLVSTTYVVDANMPAAGWGEPLWLHPDSFFRRTWSGIDVLIQTTESAAGHFAKDSIDFLHIDANHSRSMQDFQLWAPLVRIGGMITLHDTRTHGTDLQRTLSHVRDDRSFQMILLDDVGAGIALVRRAS